MCMDDSQLMEEKLLFMWNTALDRKLNDLLGAGSGLSLFGEVLAT